MKATEATKTIAVSIVKRKDGLTTKQCPHVTRSSPSDLQHFVSGIKSMIHTINLT